MFIKSIGFTTFVAAAFVSISFASETLGSIDPQLVKARGGILQTTSEQYVFDLTSCAIWVEDGEYDIEAHGPGAGPDGRVIFFEFSSTGRHLSVGFDIDSVFQSASEKLAAYNLDVAVSDTMVTVSDLELRDQDNNLVGPGSLAFDCQPVS